MLTCAGSRTFCIKIVNGIGRVRENVDVVYLARASRDIGSGVVSVRDACPSQANNNGPSIHTGSCFAQAAFGTALGVSA